MRVVGVHVYLGVVAVVSSLLLQAPSVQSQSKSQSQRTLLFFDDHPLNLRENVARHVGQPSLVVDEADTVSSIYRDPSIDLCINWGYPSVYECPSIGNETLCMMYEAQSFSDGKHTVYMNLATSRDGIHWKPYNTSSFLPNLEGRVYFNQVLPQAPHSNDECGSVISDPTLGAGGLRLFCEQSMWTSTDGIKWTNTEIPWQPHPTDYPVCAFWNNVSGRFQMLARPQNSDRRIATHFFNKNWSQYDLPVLSLDCDALDTPLAEIYGAYAFYYHGYYISFLDIYHVPQGLTPDEVANNSPHKYLTGKSDVQLAYSLNGLYWSRTIRSSFISNGPPGAVDAGLIYPTAVRVQPDKSIIVTASTSPVEHGIFSYNNGSGTGNVVSYHLREHGFVFLESSGGIGKVGTRVMWWVGGNATINANAAGGSIRFRVTDSKNIPITGYDFDNSVVMTSDDTGFSPVWNDNDSLESGSSIRTLAQLGGQGRKSVLRLEFEMVNARLYAISGDFVPLASTEVNGPFPPVARPGFEPGW